jgi:hypothetical protein
MPPGSPKDLDGRQISAFYPKKEAGTGKNRIPGNLKVGTLKTIRRRGAGFSFHGPEFTFLYFLSQPFTLVKPRYV